MKIEAARYEGGELILKTSSPDARKLVFRFRPGDYDITAKKKRRSLDANAFAWKLIHEISGATGIPPVEVYRDSVANVGGTADVIIVDERAAESFTRAFIGDHIGRQVETMPARQEGWVTCICHYGSSDFSVQQMSVLIDNLIQDANALGIVTPEQERINTLLEDWNAKAHKGTTNPA